MEIDHKKLEEFLGRAVVDWGAAMGAQAGDSQYSEMMKSAGFTRFRKATQTPFNRVFEVRP